MIHASPLVLAAHYELGVFVIEDDLDVAIGSGLNGVDNNVRYNLF